MEGGNQTNRFSVFQKGLGSMFKVFQEGLGSIFYVFQQGLGSILEGLGLDFRSPWANVGTILALCWHPFGKLTALLGKLMENPRLLLENLFSMYVGHGSGWAGGVTRSVKNFNMKIHLLCKKNRHANKK